MNEEKVVEMNSCIGDAGAVVENGISVVVVEKKRGRGRPKKPPRERNSVEKWIQKPEIERRILNKDITREEVEENEGYAYVLGLIDAEVVEEEKHIKGGTYVWLTRDIYNKMEYAFKRNLTHLQMRSWAGIGLEKYKKLIRKYPRLKEMEETWKGFVCSKAKMNIADKVESGDIDTSKWVLEKLERQEYGKAGDNSRSGGGITLNLEVDMKKVDEMRRLLMRNAGGIVDAECEIIDNNGLALEGKEY